MDPNNFNPHYAQHLSAEQRATLLKYQQQAAETAEAEAAALAAANANKANPKMNIRDKVKKYQNWPNGEVFVMGSDVASKTERIMTEETRNRVQKFTIEDQKKLH